MKYHDVAALVDAEFRFRYYVPDDWTIGASNIEEKGESFYVISIRDERGDLVTYGSTLIITPAHIARFVDYFMDGIRRNLFQPKEET